MMHTRDIKKNKQILQYHKIEPTASNFGSIVYVLCDNNLNRFQMEISNDCKHIQVLALNGKDSEWIWMKKSERERDFFFQIGAFTEDARTGALSHVIECEYFIWK